MYKVVLLRHGESTWNKENRFTGWTDVDLSEKGREEARQAGVLLRAGVFVFQGAYRSVLKRAIRTCWMALDELDLLWIPVIRNWRLNERHYGALQGLNKAETAEKHGDEQTLIWRRSYDIPPPPLEAGDPRHPAHDPRYADVPPADRPSTESLKDTVARFVLVKYLDQISDTDIVGLNIPTGIPLVYELDADMKPTRSYYLGDPDAARRAAEAVARQAQAGK